MNLDELTPEELIARFIIESKGRGHFLAYEDHDIVKIGSKLQGQILIAFF